MACGTVERDDARTECVGTTPEEFAAFIAEDAKLWTKLVKDSGAKAD